MTFREAYKLAGKNAAGLIQAMDLEQLFGGDATVEGHEELFQRAQDKLVEFLTQHFSK